MYTYTVSTKCTSRLVTNIYNINFTKIVCDCMILKHCLHRGVKETNRDVVNMSSYTCIHKTKTNAKRIFEKTFSKNIYTTLQYYGHIIETRNA